MSSIIIITFFWGWEREKGGGGGLECFVVVALFPFYMS